MAVAIIAPTSKRPRGLQTSGRPATGHPPARRPARHDGVAVLALAEDTADGVVQQPEHHEDRRHDDGGGGRQSIFDLSMVGAGAVEVRHREQRKAAEARSCSSPKEPVQVFGQLRRRTLNLTGW